MPETVTWQDARAVFHLLDELKQLRHDTLAWRRHLLTGLRPLVGAQVGLAAEVPEQGLLNPACHLGSVDTGWESASARRAWMKLCERTEPDLDPSDARLAQLGVGTYTLTRQELACDRSWYRSGAFNDHYRPAHINHSLLSLLHVPGHGALHYVFLFKEQSQRPFTDRERQLVHHLHGELGTLWSAASSVRLPRRLQQTLSLLQAGYGEKEVADRLQLSPQTVHDYCKALHKRLQARSRSELLAKARALPQAPRLLMEDRHGDARGANPT
jgi:DNA-binding NarL/FixJ family response regulator